MSGPGDVEELFELELWGGATERRYRAVRSEVEAMPWGTLDKSGFTAEQLADARTQWTVAAFQEHRTGAQCASTLRALFLCKAPIDLIACFARFPLDEAVHVELAARMAMELGGAVELVHTIADMVKEPDGRLSTLQQAAELVVRTFCVGESLSIPLLHAAWQAATQPLPRAVLGRIVKDEAAHGVVGWTFLEWAAPFLDADDRRHLQGVADHAVGEVLKLWSPIKAREKSAVTGPNGVGWIGDDAYIALAETALAERVVKPLLARGIAVRTDHLPAAVRARLG